MTRCGRASIPALPPRLAGAVGARRGEPVVRGMSGARVVRWVGAPGAPDAATLFLKTARLGRPDGDESLHDEAARLVWMAARGLPVPRVHAYELWRGGEYLLLGEVPGEDADSAARSAPAADVVDALADGLRLLHATPAGDCPFAMDVSARIALARDRVRAGLVDALDFDDERRGRSPEALLAELEATRPAADGLAFTHGDYSLPNVIVSAARGVGGGSVAPVALSGFVDCGRAGLADRYQDLALAERGVRWKLGGEWVPRLYARYGLAAVDRRRLDFYTLLDEFF
jgi:aminoglycoside 3'-phosphotransferase-2